MKKIIKIILLFIIICSNNIAYAKEAEFNFDSNLLSFNSNSKKNKVTNEFNQYKLTSSIEKNDDEYENEIKDLVKKTTYLLIGKMNTTEESTEEFYNRHKEYEEMAAYEHFPKDSSTKSGYDETNPNYIYAKISELAIPQIFSKISKLGIIYNSYGAIRISKKDDLVIASVTLPSVKIREEDIENPKKYNFVETDLTMFYYYLEIDGEYRLAYMFGETKKELSKYFDEVESVEGTNAVATHASNLSTIYDYSKLDKVTNEDLENIYNKNINNIVLLNSYYNTSIVSQANGFFINDGLIITTWDYLEDSLINAQYVTVSNKNGDIYELDGIVTANPETNIAIIKIKNKTGSSVTLADKENVKVEDVAIVISSKNGIGFTTQKGLIASNDNYIQTTIPLLKADQGSPVLDINGNVIGINTAKAVNTSISIAINTDILKEIKEKFNSIEFDKIDFVTFEKLKEEYYYTKIDTENEINSIPNSKWKKYKKIGDIENTISLKLLKASYKDKIVSLRYQNNISKYIDSIQLTRKFRNELENEGYKEIYNSIDKITYQSKKYEVIIMKEFDYLIIVMVKL